MPFGFNHRKGFTLIEMLIVSSMIVLLAGLAMIGAQRLFDDSKRKAIFDETKSIGTGLSMARQDVGFFPRISHLGLPLNLIHRTVSASSNAYFVRPGIDAYGYYGSGLILTLPQCLYAVNNNWRGPYMPLVESRAMAAAGKRTGMIRMRLPDYEYTAGGFPKFPTNDGEDTSIVPWPTDAWGNPYVVYLMTSDNAYVQGGNPLGLRFIKEPIESGDYFTGVVSYGKNGAPGGNEQYEGYPDTCLYVKNMTPDNTYDYTLKSLSPLVNASFRLPNEISTVIPYAQSVKNGTANPGILENGSDDIFFKFN